MRLDLSYKPWLAARKRSTDGHHVLTYCHVERTDKTIGVVTAANNYILVRVPCELTARDEPGIVRADSLRRAIKESRGLPYGSRPNLILAADYIGLDDHGYRWPRYFPGDKPDELIALFPPITRVTNALEPAQTGALTLTPHLLWRVARALGSDSTHRGLKLEFSGPVGRVRLTLGDDLIAWGALMPCR